MTGHQGVCAVCSTCAPSAAPFHHITHTKTLGKPNEASLAERVAKILHVDDIYLLYQDRMYMQPLQICRVCMAHLTQIEAALKVRQRLKQSFRKRLGTLGSKQCGTIVREKCQRSGSSDKTSESKKKKKRKSECELSVENLELCISDIDELISHTLQVELINKTKSPGEKTDEPELLSTELAIVKEMFMELDKEMRKIESPSKLSGSTKITSVVHELLVKQRITSEYKDKLVQHLKRMIAYINKYSSKFECEGDGLQKFCNILQIIFCQDSKRDDTECGDETSWDCDSDSLSNSSTQSGIRPSNISLNLQQSVEDIFKQTASEIAQTWRESRHLAKTTNSPTSPSRKQITNNEIPVISGKEELAIGAHIQMIINDMEEEEQEEEESLEIIDIESCGSEISDKARKCEDGETRKSDGDEEKDADDVNGAGSASSDQDGRMVIDDDDDESDQCAASEHKVKQEPATAQDDIQEIKQAAKIVPVICIDSDAEEEEKSDQETGDDATTVGDPFDVSSRLSYEEARWQYQQKPEVQESKDCFIVTSKPSNNSNAQSTCRSTPQENLASAENIVVSGSQNVFNRNGNIVVNVGGDSEQKQVKYVQLNHGANFIGKRHGNVWRGGQGYQGWSPPRNIGYNHYSQNKFKFGKNMKYKKHYYQQSTPQTYMGGLNSYQNKILHRQKFQFHKNRKFERHQQPTVGGMVNLPHEIRSRKTASKLDIIPVIPGRNLKIQAGSSSNNEQRNKQTLKTDQSVGGAANQQKSQNPKFKFKKMLFARQHRNKKQQLNDPGSLQANTGSPNNYADHITGSMLRPGNSQKSSQPPVMHVLGSSSAQTLKVKANCK